MFADLRIVPKLLVWAGLMLAPTIGHAAPANAPLMVPNELIVKFKSGTPGHRIRALTSQRALNAIQELREIRAYHYRAPSPYDIWALVSSLRRLPEVEYAEPNYLRYLNFIPDDPLYMWQYTLDNQGQTGGTPDADIDLPEAWDLTTGSRAVVVAVIDSGIDLDHPDLVDNIFVNPGEIPDNGIDDDGNGFVDDVSGWDFIGGDNDPSDPYAVCRGHGTHAAGIIGAVGNNGIGVSGVSQRVSILPIRVFRSIFGLCAASVAALVPAVKYAEKMGVDISNNSWGGFLPSLAMYDAIGRSRHLFIAAAGNSSANTASLPFYPAAYPQDHVMSIAATDHDDLLTDYSNFGIRSVDLAAPGDGILSTLTGGEYGILSGTSMAAPQVAGVAALLLAAEPDLTPRELKHRLMAGSDPRALPVISGGRLNAYGALTLPPSSVGIELTTTAPIVIRRGDAYSFELVIENRTDEARSFDVSLYVWGPLGLYPPAGPYRIGLAPRQSASTAISGVLPFGISPGEYRFVGAIEGPGDSFFDESQIVYTVK